MQAVMLAAGMGKRLGKYTKGNTKCMLEVNGKTLIERTIEALLASGGGVTKLIVVTGYQGDNLKRFLTEECTNPKIKELEIEFIENPIYDKTNNIYSLYLAKDKLKEDDTILLESDLIYDYSLIKRLIEAPEENLVSVAKYEQWMDGTVIKIDDENNVVEFIEKKNFDYNEIEKYYKTVNIYKFGKEFLNNIFIPFLESYIKAYGENEYYELVLKIIAHLSRSELKALDVSDIPWYEIDDAQDLDIAKCIFSKGKEKLENFQKRYGGYWRFENIIDYCYLVNPYFPPKQMIEKMNYFSHNLITQYPSGQKIECINASRLFDVEEEYLCVGNGAAELINALGRILKGKMYVTKTAFNEYFRCFHNCEFTLFDMQKKEFQYDLEDIMKNTLNNDIICLVNPDNPTGAFITQEEIMPILDKCKELNKIVIFDESFIDFADKEKRYTLLTNEILNQYDNLIVIKSISKSYGIPGIRLGVLATSNKTLMQQIKKYISIWNINSYGEYFLQIANLYKKDYVSACEKIAEERKIFSQELAKLPGLYVYPSQANYLLCSLENYDSTNLAIELLENNIFIKDLKTKSSFKDMDYIRLAIRTREENEELIYTLTKILK